MTSRPCLETCDVTVLDAPFHAEGNIATTGGCLASQYLAAWVITRMLGEQAARDVIGYVAPVGETTSSAPCVQSTLASSHSADAPRPRPASSGTRAADMPASRTKWPSRGRK